MLMLKKQKLVDSGVQSEVWSANWGRHVFKLPFGETWRNGFKEKSSPQMVPCNISSSCRQMSLGGRKLQGSLDRKKKKERKEKRVTVFCRYLKQSERMYQFYLIVPIKLLESSAWNGFCAETLLNLWSKLGQIDRVGRLKSRNNRLF